MTRKDREHEEQITEKSDKPYVLGQVNSFMKNIRNIGQGILTNTANTASFSSQSEYLSNDDANS